MKKQFEKNARPGTRAKPKSGKDSAPFAETERKKATEEVKVNDFTPERATKEKIPDSWEELLDEERIQPTNASMASVNQLTKTPVKEALYESDSTSVQLPIMKRQFEKKARPGTKVKRFRDFVEMRFRRVLILVMTITYSNYPSSLSFSLLYCMFLFSLRFLLPTFLLFLFSL